MTTRKITSQQFVTNGTIDGERLQTALAETEQFINNVPLDVIKQKYSLNYLVFTRLGADDPHQRNCPFLAGTINGSERVKGIYKDVNSDVNYILQPTVAANFFQPHVWTVSTYFYRPVILDSICLYMKNNNIGSGLPGGAHDFDFWNPGLTWYKGGAYQRIRVLIDSDDAVASEDRSLNSKEYALQDFQENFYRDDNHSSVTSMQPVNFPGEAIQLERNNINLPLHYKSRVRFRIVLYLDAGAAKPLLGSTAENVTFTIVYKEALTGG